MVWCTPHRGARLITDLNGTHIANPFLLPSIIYFYINAFGLDCLIIIIIIIFFYKTVTSGQGVGVRMI